MEAEAFVWEKEGQSRRGTCSGFLLGDVGRARFGDGLLAARLPICRSCEARGARERSISIAASFPRVGNLLFPAIRDHGFPDSSLGSVVRIDQFLTQVHIFFTTPVCELPFSVMSIFVYAYALSDAPIDLEDFVGVEERNLFMVTVGEVSAIVSSYNSNKISLVGKDIFAHQDAHRKLMEQATIIPLQYGLTLKSLAAVEEVLLKNKDALYAELLRLYRKVEMEVTMRFDVDDLLDHLVDRYPYLRDEKAKVLNGRLLYYLGNRAKKGEKFQKTLRKEKEIYAAKLKEVIGPWCAEIKQSRLPLSEADVVTFNCLVNRERLRVFEKSIYDAGDLFAPDFAFTYNGPWAPQNFSDHTRISYK